MLPCTAVFAIKWPFAVTALIRNRPAFLPEVIVPPEVLINLCLVSMLVVTLISVGAELNLLSFGVDLVTSVALALRQCRCPLTIMLLTRSPGPKLFVTFENIIVRGVHPSTRRRAVVVVPIAFTFVAAVIIARLLSLLSIMAKFVLCVL